MATIEPHRANLKAWLLEESRNLGFDALGMTRPDAIPLATGRLRSFLETGAHGSMEWMARHEDRRGDPRILWPEARTVIMLAANYAPDEDPLRALEKRDHATVSVYAQRRDYHDVLKRNLKQIARALAERSGGEVKVFVDTAPLMEKPLAAAAGLGWQGKHTNLVSRKFGSWLFLAAILTTAEIDPDTPEQDHCGSCQRCITICPTEAIVAPYRLDARKCIAYLTIEHAGHIAHEFRRPMGNRVFGCDDCLAVCPWNRFAQKSHNQALATRQELRALPLSDVLAMDDAAFRKRFAGTPIKRTGRDRVVRNALIAAGNSGDAGLLDGVEALLGDPSPIVRAMAVWALTQLADGPTAARNRDRRAGDETDETVRLEWAHSTSSGS